MQAELPHGIEQLCFPDSDHWTPKTVDPSQRICRTYSLVLTDLNGCRTFGYCRRVLPEGADVALPLVYCIISSKRAYNLYNKVRDHKNVVSQTIASFKPPLFSVVLLCLMNLCCKIINLLPFVCETSFMFRE